MADQDKQSTERAGVPEPVRTPGWHVLHYLLDKLGRLSNRQIALIVFTAGMAVFAVLTYILRPLANIQLPLGHDSYDGYLQLARNLLAGNGYVFEPGGPKVFHRPPMYPLLLLPGAWLPEGVCRVYVAALNSSLLACAALLLRKLGLKIFPARTATLAALVFGLNPFVLWAAKNPMAPILQTLAYLLMLYSGYSVYQVIRDGGNFSGRLVMAFTTALALGSLSHGTMLMGSALLLGVLFIFALRRRHLPGALRLVVCGFLLCLVIAPWTWRNYRVTGMFLPVAGNSGLAYFAGNAHWGIGAPATYPSEDPRQSTLRHIGYVPEDFGEMLHYYGLREPRWEKVANERARIHMRQHPGAVLKKMGLNAVEYYFPIFYYLAPPPGTLAAEQPLSWVLRFQANADAIPLSLYNLVLLSLAAAGFLKLFRQRNLRFAGLLMMIAWAFFAVPYLPFLTFVAHGLYTFGTLPVLSLAAAVAVSLKTVRGWESLPTAGEQPG